MESRKNKKNYSIKFRQIKKCAPAKKLFWFNGQTKAGYLEGGQTAFSK